MLIFYSKKFWVSLVGLVFAILAANGLKVSEDIQSKLLELILVIVSSFNVGQGIADGWSKGATSCVAIQAEKRRDERASRNKQASKSTI